MPTAIATAEATPTALIQATQTPLSNSERLARGLPLNKPKVLFDPTKVKSLVPRQSSLTPAQPEGNNDNNAGPDGVTSAPTSDPSSSSSSSPSASASAPDSISTSHSASTSASSSVSAIASASSSSSVTSTTSTSEPASSSASTSSSSSASAEATIKPSNPLAAPPVVTQAVRASFANGNGNSASKRDEDGSGNTGSSDDFGLGYLWGMYPGGGVWGLTSNKSEAANLIFQQDATGSFNNILIKDTFYDPQYDLPYLATGWVTWSNYQNYGYNSPKNNLGNGNCIGFTRSDYNPPGFAMSQTAIWKAPTPGGELIFEWTNQDGTVVQGNFYLRDDIDIPLIRIAAKGEDCDIPEYRRIRLFIDA
ncbi:uncharacterized protein I303_103313 [Kwoniella dejecticola CBS 10117]|uniref:Uncharacterized protein n=1 Tax=Kwoniella dejecticola CBS 10117 TaxID=1296121 RepID=A0A1A6A6E3_9TREE|nr:uncharacterized protein I303_03336 [Kwoniella dejecticola CBS 10117]OBR85625.1 hypothetical protein I303_03336 [Kwoniella dejecticola CBS 10117]